MQFLRNIVDNGRKLYHEPGSKLHKVWPLLDAMETFLFSPAEKAPEKGPQVRDYIDLKRVMVTVILALIPCLAWSVWNQGVQHFAALTAMGGLADGVPYAAGWLQGLLFGDGYAPTGDATDNIVFGLQQMLPIIFVSYFVGLNIEGAFAVWRKHEISEGFLVSGILIALIVPASIPLWQLALGVAFSVILVKEIFGGTGMNIFNVALMTRAFLFFAYPAQISGDRVWVAGNGPTDLVDGYSRPTPLASAKAMNNQAGYQGEAALTEDPVGGVASWVDAEGGRYFADAPQALDAAGYSWWDMFIGNIPGSAGETSVICALLGAVLLLVTGIGSWRIMLSGIIGLFAGGLLLNTLGATGDGLMTLPAHYHLVMGGFAFGLVFMATDPVTCPETFVGKWIYGGLIGFLVALVRTVNPAYPEATFLVILLLNAFAPTIDYFVVQANVRRRAKRLG